MKKRKLKKKVKIFFCLLLLPFLVIVLGKLYAKYAYTVSDLIVVGDDASFVLESDYLTDESTIREFNIYDDSITFNIKNNKDENILITNDNINYTVISTCGTLSQNSGTLVKNTNNDDSITLTSNRLQSCDVTLTTTSPFAKTLRARFNFVGIGDATSYKITDKDYYIILDLYTGYNLEDVSIDYTGFKPDTTNQLMNNWTSGTTGTIDDSNLTEYTHYELRFLKVTSTGIYNTTGKRNYTTTIDLDA